jgi:hypothetical protein
MQSHFARTAIRRQLEYAAAERTALLHKVEETIEAAQPAATLLRTAL